MNLAEISRRCFLENFQVCYWMQCSYECIYEPLVLSKIVADDIYIYIFY